MPHAMGDKLDAYVYDYDAGGNDAVLCWCGPQWTSRVACFAPAGGGTTPLRPPLLAGIPGGIG